MKVVYLFIGFVIMISCNMSDYSKELPGSYTFLHEGKDYNIIFGGRHNILPNVVKYVFDDNYILIFQKPHDFFYRNFYARNLWSDYYCYNYYMKDSLSEKFSKSRNEMLADSVIFKIFKNKGVSFENSSDDIKKSEDIADSIIKNNPLHKKVFSLKEVYWIIQIKGDVLYGPLNYEEYKHLRVKLKVSNDLTLETKKD